MLDALLGLEMRIDFGCGCGYSPHRLVKCPLLCIHATRYDIPAAAAGSDTTGFGGASALGPPLNGRLRGLRVRADSG